MIPMEGVASDSLRCLPTLRQLSGQAHVTSGEGDAAIANIFASMVALVLRHDVSLQFAHDELCGLTNIATEFCRCSIMRIDECRDHYTGGISVFEPAPPAAISAPRSRKCYRAAEQWPRRRALRSLPAAL